MLIASDAIPHNNSPAHDRAGHCVLFATTSVGGGRRTFKPRPCAGCNRPVIIGYWSGFPLQAAPMRGLQLRLPRASHISGHTFKPRPCAGCNSVTIPDSVTSIAFKLRPCAGCNGNSAQVLRLMHGLLCAYLNLFECIARFETQSLTATVSILGREVAPEFVRTFREFHVCLRFAPIAFAMILSMFRMEIFWEALKSAFAEKPHFVQQKSA